MKKFLLSLSFLLVNISFAHALVCVDLSTDLTKGKETSDVLVLQNFLATKGFLTAKPNGYFGDGTFSAVKKYQKSVNLSQSGGVLPLTRAAIKKETCLALTAASSTELDTKLRDVFAKVTINPLLPPGCFSTSGFSRLTGISCSTAFLAGCSSFEGFSTTSGLSCIQAVTATSTAIPVVVSTTTIVVPVAPKLPLTANDRRQADVVTLLSAMYAFYHDSNGRFPIPYIATSSVEICTLGISLCDNLNEVKSSLVPRFLATIPMDPTISSSTGSGYFITRLSDGTVKVSAPKADNKASIFATCNFTSNCKITIAADVVLGKPYIESLDKAIFLSGGIMSIPLVIHGNNFSPATNTVSLFYRDGRKTYTLGIFPSVDGVTISASSSFTITPLSCGGSCLENLPVGVYDVIVTTEKGESNHGFISLQPITGKSFSNGNDKPFTPNTKNVKFGTVTLSSQALIGLKTFSFALQGTSTLLSKITNFKIVDASTAKTVGTTLGTTLPDETVSNNATKIYEIYADVAETDVSYTGRVDILGTFTVKELISNSIVTVPLPKMMITISY